MVPAFAATTKQAPRLGFVYVPHGAVMAHWKPDTVGTGFEFKQILKPLEPYRDRLNIVSQLHHRAADSTAVHSLLADHVAERRTAETDPGRGRVRRRHGRSDRRRCDRPGHAAAVDGARHRGPLRLDRRLRPRLRLHLHEHALLAHGNVADADGDQSAQSVRADVRSRRQRGSAPRAPSRGSQHPRCADGAGHGVAAPARRSRPRDSGSLSRRCPRDRAAAHAR